MFGYRTVKFAVERRMLKVTDSKCFGDGGMVRWSEHEDGRTQDAAWGTDSPVVVTSRSGRYPLVTSPQHPLAGDITMPERVARGEGGDAAPDLDRRLGGGVTGRAAGASPSGSGLSRYSNMYAETEPAPP